MTVNPLAPTIAWSSNSAINSQGSVNALGTVSDRVKSLNADRHRLKSLAISTILLGAMLSDEAHGFTTAAASTSVAIGGWTLSCRTMALASGANCTPTVPAIVQSAAGTAATVVRAPASTTRAERSPVRRGTIGDPAKGLTLDANSVNSTVLSRIPGAATLRDGAHGFTAATGRISVGRWKPFGLAIMASAITFRVTTATTKQSTQSNVRSVSATQAVTANVFSSGYADGSANAPVGKAELPNLFSGYAVRPPWHVAGVDYYVGVPNGTTLKDPTIQANLPIGATADNTNHIIRIVASNVTIHGFDFSLHGGWGVYIQPGSTNTIIESSNFFGGIIQAAVGSGNLTVTNCILNGGGGVLDVNPTAVNSEVAYMGSGTLTVKYNWIRDFIQHAVEFDRGPGTLVMEYNLIESGGYYNGAHVNFSQFNGSIAKNSVINFNTVVQPQPGLGGFPFGGGQGLQVYAQSGSTVTNTQVKNNVVIARGRSSKSMSYGIAVTVENNNGGNNVLNGAYVEGNYMDMTGAFGPFYLPKKGAINLVFNNNLSLVNGTQFATPSGASVSDVTNVTAAPPSGTEAPGATITLTLQMDQPMIVTGTPTLTLNDGGTATYASGSVTDALTFNYTVSKNGATVSALAITEVNLPGGATVKDSVGNAANLSGALVTFNGLAVGR